MPYLMEDRAVVIYSFKMHKYVDHLIIKKLDDGEFEYIFENEIIWSTYEGEMTPQMRYYNCL